MREEVYVTMHVPGSTIMRFLGCKYALVDVKQGQRVSRSEDLFSLYRESATTQRLKDGAIRAPVDGIVSWVAPGRVGFGGKCLALRILKTESEDQPALTRHACEKVLSKCRAVRDAYEERRQASQWVAVEFAIAQALVTLACVWIFHIWPSMGNAEILLTVIVFTGLAYFCFDRASASWKEAKRQQKLKDEYPGDWEVFQSLSSTLEILPVDHQKEFEDMVQGDENIMAALRLFELRTPGWSFQQVAFRMRHLESLIAAGVSRLSLAEVGRAQTLLFSLKERFPAFC